jgi:Fur family ferric uptake transcriptional regulator
MVTSDFVRHTRQRQVILEELRNTDIHPTAAELHGLVQIRLPKISLGTVYRNLELLVKNGMARKLDSGSAQARYDGDIHDHYHIRCVDCGRLDDIPVEATKTDPGRVTRMKGYKIVGYRLEFAGICKHCQGRQRRGQRRSTPDRPVQTKQ